MCDRFLKRLIKLNPDYTPYTQADDFLFLRLEAALIEVSQWDDFTSEIERNCFEDLLVNNRDLVNAYVELYSSSARFFTSEMELKEERYEFFMMVREQRIALIFYRKVVEGE